MIPLRDDIPSVRRPFFTYALIGITLAVYVLQWVSGSGQEIWAWKHGLVPYELTHGVEITPGMRAPVMTNVVTSMFLHGGIWHLAGNMLYLWIFGDNVEDRLGHVRFLIFYLVCGIVATLFFVWTAPELQIPLVGASGAIAGVLGAYVVSYPRARVATLIFFGFFIRVVYIPAMVVLGFWFLIQLLQGLPTVGDATARGGVAFMAHAGGFVVGAILVWLMWPRWRPKRFTRRAY